MPELLKLAKKVVDGIVLDDAPTSVTSDSFRIGGMDKVSFGISVTKTSTPTNVIFTVEVSPDGGTTWLSYDKLLDGSGTDAPVASITYTDTAEDVCSMSPEDVFDLARVIFTGTGTTSSLKFTCNCWVNGK